MVKRGFTMCFGFSLSRNQVSAITEILRLIEDQEYSVYLPEDLYVLPETTEWEGKDIKTLLREKGLHTFDANLNLDSSQSSSKKELGVTLDASRSLQPGLIDNEALNQLTSNEMIVNEEFFSFLAESLKHSITLP